MNTKLILVFLFYTTKTLHSFAMHNPIAVPVIPVEIDNRSNITVTVLYDKLLQIQPKPGRLTKADIVFPGKLFTECNNCKCPELTSEKDIRIATSQGHFQVYIDDMSNPPIIVFSLANIQGWKRFDPISLFALTKITARVQADGFIKLIQHKHTPQDGRPDVSLLAYEELLGTQYFATPEQILGVMPGINPEEAYRKRVAERCANHHRYSDPDAISLLLFWAARKLGVKHP